MIDVLSTVASRIMDADAQRSFAARRKKSPAEQLQWHLLLLLNHQFFCRSISDKGAAYCYTLLGVDFQSMYRARYRSMYLIEPASTNAYWQYNH